MSRAALRAPVENGACLADPPLEMVGAVLEANSQRLHCATLSIVGRPIDDLRQQLRLEALAAARQYLAARGEPAAEAATGPLFVAGHQPELFHPGVWVKSFALQGLAPAHTGVALNLVIDNDTVKHASISLPTPPGDHQSYPRLLNLAFDRWTGETPHEEATIQDASLFRSFGERGCDILNGWGYEPLLSSFWPAVLRQTEREPRWSDAFAAARRGVERSWGCDNLEVPLSRLCATEPFAWFVAALLADLPRFHAAHNDCLREYRQTHGLRSRSHPVPDLAADGSWLETPLWGWRAGQTRRDRLFARPTAGRLELRCGPDPWPGLPYPQQETMADFLTAWIDLAHQGFKVRTRALTTTLFTRLFLADLFVHGIGGGKYDELTDAICRRFLDFELPEYLVLSATLLLPLPLYPATMEERRRLIRQGRDIPYNPERFLGENTDAAPRALMAEKQAWVAMAPQARSARRERFVRLRALNAQLSDPLAGRAAQVARELASCQRQLEVNALLRRRDYAFCLYPETLLRPFCTSFFARPLNLDACAR